jgi:hypothetical protein
LLSFKQGVYTSLLGGSDELVDGVEGLPSTVAANLISSLTSIVSVSDTSSIDAEAWGT